LLAVYGTLKQGYYNYNEFLTGLNPIYKGFIESKFQLYSNGRYPMIVHSEELNKIYFEVYQVSNDKFKEIIQLEEPFGYHHETFWIPELNQNADTFVFSSGIPPEEFLLVKSGNWESTIPWE
jgi:gamma-glutamylcyclotransferase (GGCT)/AIG2-like uncharacterized protein YtfP